MKYLHKFTSMADFQAAYDGQDYIEPWVSLTKEGVPTKVSCSNQYEDVYILEYQGQASVGGSGNYYIWKDSNDGFYATETRTIEDETEISYLYITEGDEYDWNDGSFSADAVEVLESEEGINYVHYNKKLPVYDFIIDYSGGDAWNGLKITYINPSFGSYEEVETQTDPSFYGYMMDNISSIILKQTLSVQILNSEGGPTEIVVPFEETDGTDYYDWTVSGSGWNTIIYLERNNNYFDEGWVLRITHNEEG